MLEETLNREGLGRDQELGDTLLMLVFLTKLIMPTLVAI